MQILEKIRKNFVFYFLTGFLVIELFNPVLKKYDYGAGFPLLIVFACLLPLAVWALWRERHEKAILEKSFLIIFGGGMILSFVYSQTKNLGFSEVLAWLSVIVLYWILAYRKHIWSERFLKFLRVIVLLAILLGFVFYFWLAEVRMFGPFFNVLYHANKWPNAFGLFLVMTWPLFLLNNKGRVWWKILSLSFVISALLLTFSRGALIVLFGQLVLLAIFFRQRIFLRKMLLSALSVALISSLIFVGSNYLRSLRHQVIHASDRLTFQNQQSLTSKQERIDFWEGAIKLIKEKPWFGHGPFSFRQAYSPIQETFLGNSDHPHNVFLKIGAENGLITLGAFLGFLITFLVTFMRRFSELPPEQRSVALILFVAVSGAFAHNLIDYNFNFFSNLLILFIYLALMRSMLIGCRDFSMKKPLFILAISLWIFIVAFDEGSLFVLAKVKNEAFLENSRYPRNYYLNQAEIALKDEDFDDALAYLDKQKDLNEYDAQTYYLEGTVYCNEKYAKRDLLRCVEIMGKALQLSPKNDFEYYRAYYSALEQLPGKNENEQLTVLREKSLKLLNIYFGYVENNVHFTAYTTNVQKASQLIDLIVPYLNSMEAIELKKKKEKMLEKAYGLRVSKTF